VQLDPKWSFDEALAEISAIYRPGSFRGGPQRNRLIEVWGQLVGRTRALREFDQAVKEHGSLTALGRARGITISTLRSLRSDYALLPDDSSRSGRLIAGDMLGQWHLVQRIGGGGSAEVWRARSIHGDVAIKILRQASGRPFKRFRAEVDLLRSITGQDGVLPMLDAHVPTALAAGERVWLVMPLAKVVSEHSVTLTPEQTVTGVNQIATTMARLHSGRVFHRDLKPENLYEWNGRWVVGDFGIASFPGKKSVTTGSSKLGPVHFIAPEMLHNPETAQGGPADVYSLAKTLWVLLCGQRYPPPGEQRSDIQAVRLEEWVDSPRIGLLNVVMERCTRYSPDDRLTMAQFASALDDWLTR
jgi:eukaryotic-like serine/threonine-protein kinase